MFAVAGKPNIMVVTLGCQWWHGSESVNWGFTANFWLIREWYALKLKCSAITFAELLFTW